MNLNKIALAAIILWLATIGAAVWFFVRGNTDTGTDGRTAIVLDAREHGLVLAEMRGLLLSIRDMLDGLNKNDMKQVAQAARAGGMGVAADLDAGLMAKLPISFKQPGLSMHQRMDEIASAAENGKQQPEIMSMMTEVLSSCVACHASWQLKVATQSK